MSGLRLITSKTSCVAVLWDDDSDRTGRSAAIRGYMPPCDLRSCARLELEQLFTVGNGVLSDLEYLPFMF